MNDEKVKTCAKCHKPWLLSATEIKHDRPDCSACRAVYRRNLRKTNASTVLASELQRKRERRKDPVEKWKERARRIARRAVKRGRLVRGPCETCGTTSAEAHHDDYSKPYEVRWLCPRHHRQHHLSVGAA